MNRTSARKPRKYSNTFLLVCPLLCMLAGLSIFAVEREGLLQPSSTGELTISLTVGERLSGGAITGAIESFVSINDETGEIFVCPPVPTETTFQVSTHNAAGRAGRGRDALRGRRGGNDGARRVKRWRSPATRKCALEEAIVLPKLGAGNDPIFEGSRTIRSVLRLFLAAE